MDDLVANMRYKDLLMLHVMENLRCAHPTFKLPKGFFWWKEVIILILQVIQLQIARTIHSQQLITYKLAQE